MMHLLRHFNSRYSSRAFKGTIRITIDMYLVVEFLDTKDMAVVPKSWCICTDSQQLTLSWPPHRDPCKLNKLVSDNAVPISQWNQYIARRIASSDDYLRARQKLEKAQYTSNVDTSCSESENNQKTIRMPSRNKKRTTSKLSTANAAKHKRKRTCLVIPSSSSCSSEEEASASNELLDAPDIVPPNIFENADLSSSAANLFVTTTSTVSPVVTASSTPRYVMHDSSNKSRYDLQDRFATGATSTGSFVIAASATSASSPLNTDISRNHSLGFQRLVVKELAELKESVAELSKQLIGVHATLNELAEKENPSNPECKFTLPLNSLSEVEGLEERLMDQKVKVAMIAQLSGIGGTTVRECTNRILRYLTNSTATHFNWMGKGDKMAFSKLTLTPVIIGAVQRNRLTKSASQLDVENSIKNWLKFAPERAGRRKNREAAKQFQC